MTLLVYSLRTSSKPGSPSLFCRIWSLHRAGAVGGPKAAHVLPSALGIQGAWKTTSTPPPHTHRRGTDLVLAEAWGLTAEG